MPDETFECGICAEDLSLELRVLIGVGDDAVCRDCIAKQFADDLARPDDEAEYEIGVMWGSRRLHAKDYPHVFTPEFIVRYEHRLLKFTTPREQRVYCPRVGNRIEGRDVVYCGTFVAAATNSAETAVCPKCRSPVCKSCRMELASATAEHLCTGPPEVPAEYEMDLSSMRRGMDYQRCPGCKRIYQLREACNYVRCAMSSCLTGFCYICGEVAGHDSDHWKVGTCPRWGQPQTEGYAKVDIDVLKLHLDRYLSQMDSKVRLPRWLQQITEHVWYIVVTWREGRDRRRFDSASMWGLGMHSWNKEVAQAEMLVVQGLADYFQGHPLRLEDLLEAIADAGEAEPVERPVHKISPPALLTTILDPIPPEAQIPIMAVFAVMEQRLGIAIPDWTRHIARDLFLVVRIHDPNTVHVSAELIRWTLALRQPRVPATFSQLHAASYCHLEALLMRNGSSVMTAIWKHYSPIEVSRASGRFLLEVPEYHYIALEATKMREKMERSQVQNLANFDREMAQAEGDDEKEGVYESIKLPENMEMLSSSTLLLFRFLRDGQALKPFEMPSLVGFWMPDIQETPEEDDPLRGQEAEALLLMAAWWQYYPRNKQLRMMLEQVHERSWAHMIGKMGRLEPTIVLVDAENRPGFHKIASSAQVPELYMEGFARDNSLFFVPAKPTNEADYEADPASVKNFRIVRVHDL